MVGRWVHTAILRIYRNPVIIGLSVPFVLLSWLSRWLDALSSLGGFWRIRSLMFDLFLMQLSMEIVTFWDYLLAYGRAVIYLYGPTIWPRVMSYLVEGVMLFTWLLLAGVVIDQSRYTATSAPPWQESLYLAWRQWPHMALVSVVLFLPAFLLSVAYSITTFLENALLEASRNLTPGPISQLLWAFFPLIFVHLAWQAIVQERRVAGGALRRAWEVFWLAPGSWLGVGIAVFIAHLLLTSLLNAAHAPLAVWLFTARGLAAGIASWLSASIMLTQALVQVGWWLASWGIFTLAWEAITRSEG